MLAVTPPTLLTERLRLSLTPPEHAPRVAAFYRRNRDHLRPWEPARPEAFFTDMFWRAQLAHSRREFADGTSLRMQIVRRDDPSDEVIGVCTLSNVVRGVFQACHLGYALSVDALGAGLMTEAVGSVVDYAFAGMALNRVMANYMPENERSGRVLRRLGFVVEGYARDYILINGRWRDHILTSKVNPEVKTAPR
jgi:ribosomal-protein-alanine N-acetyltransferase